MNLDSVQIFSDDLQSDCAIYRYLTGCSECQIHAHEDEVHFDNGGVNLFLKRAGTCPARTGRYTGLSFVSADLEFDGICLRDLGASVTPAELSACNGYWLSECSDLSGNTVTLMQLNESACFDFEQINYMR